MIHDSGPGRNTYSRAPQNIATSKTSHNLLNAVGNVLGDLIEFPHHDLKVLEAGGMFGLRLAERAGRCGLVVATVRSGLFHVSSLRYSVMKRSCKGTIPTNG